MPKVSFYILSEHSKRTVDNLVCQLCAKAAQQTPVVLMAPAAELSTYDDLLWSFDETSFLPHGINEMSSSINLTANAEPNFSGIVINLHKTEILAHQAKRIIEIIATDEASKVAGRNRYKAYKKAGYELETFNI